MPSLGTLDIEAAAKQAAGNWNRFRCFVWWRADELDNADRWAVIYLMHRDSGLLDESNAAVIRKALEPFAEGEDADLKFESHSHWAVGHIDGFSVRVFDDTGCITDAFKTYHELAERMDDYLVLDEGHYSNLEEEATYENLDFAAWRMKREYSLPAEWQSEVYDWLRRYRDTALENVDDRGGWPDEEELQAAFEALGYQRAA